MRILLACAAGMSTSLLMERMLQECEKQGRKDRIYVVDEGIIQNELGNFDVLLLGPQVRHILKRIQREVNINVPVAVIRNVDYGRCDGKAVLAYADELFEESKKTEKR